MADLRAAPGRRFIDGDFSLPHVVGVWGRLQREQAVTRGAAEERIVETGNPAWDGLAAGPPERASRRASLVRDLGLSASACWFCLAGQEEAGPQLEAVCGSLIGRGVVLLRPHPAEDLEPYRLLVERFPDRVRLATGAPLTDVLAASDACVTFHSTVNLESLLCGTPVITAALGELRRTDRLINLEEFGLPVAFDVDALAAVAAEVARDAEGFRERMRLPISRALEAALTNHRDGGAAARLAALIDPSLAVAA